MDYDVSHTHVMRTLTKLTDTKVSPLHKHADNGAPLADPCPVLCTMIMGSYGRHQPHTQALIGFEVRLNYTPGPLGCLCAATLNLLPEPIC